MKKNVDKLNIILVTTIGLLLLFAIMVIYGINVEKPSDWIGFLGSFVGTLIGAVITLLVLHNTLKNNKKNLEMTIKNNKELQSQTIRRDFINEITELISKYVTDITRYFYENKVKEKKENKLKSLTNKMLMTIKENKSDSTSETIRLNLEIEQCKASIPHVNRVISEEIYFMLQIKLQDESLATEILDELENIHNKYCYEDISFLEFNKYTNKLIQRTKEFIKQYTKE